MSAKRKSKTVVTTSGVTRPVRRGNLEQARLDRGVRRRVRKAGTLAALSGVVIAGLSGAAFAAPPAADKAPTPGGIRGGMYADTSRALEIPEGYTIRVWKYGENLRSVLPLGRALNSYEAFSQLAGSATLSITDPKKPPKVRVKGGNVTIGLQLGCASEAKSLAIAGNASDAINTSVTPSLNGTVGASANGSGGSNGGQGGGSVNGSISPGISGTLGNTVTLGGSITGTLGPGTTRDLPIAKKDLNGQTAYLISRETRVSVDGCLGGAQVRSYATATVVTDAGTSNITTYGRVLFIERDKPGDAKTPPPVKEAPVQPGQAASKPEQKPAAAPAPAPEAKPAPAPKPVPKPDAKPASAPTPEAKPAPAPKPAAMPAPGAEAKPRA
ncbi:MspA family porin [Tsukamurella tyrosinosolvens]|uniref:MspA family porin n=1 Tax=Tsukamurella tyrosinosolvens TaxID=57704 RepID=UPI000C7EDD5D|nr:MspA family porin [Tsukamurella tyrosinosolvens]